MTPLVGHGIGPDRRAEQGDAEGVPLGAVAVLGVVQEGESPARIGKVGPLECGDLELRLLFQGLLFGGPRDGGEGNLEGRRVALDIQGEGGLEKDMLLPPVRHGSDIDPIEARVEGDVLGKKGGGKILGRGRPPLEESQEALLHLEDSPQGGHGDQFDPIGLVQIPDPTGVTDVPGIPILGPILPELQEVPLLSWSQEFTVEPLVEEGREISALGADLDLEVPVLQGSGIPGELLTSLRLLR